MTDPRKDEVGVPEALPIEELIARSSIGGETDPELDDVCTDDDAADFVAQFDARQQDAPTDDESSTDDGSGERRPRHRLAEPQQVFVSYAGEPAHLPGFIGLSDAGCQDARAAAVRLREELASFACAPALGWTSLIGTLLEHLRQMVNRSDFFNFYSRFEEARFFVVNDLLPPPCLSPVVSTPHVPEEQQRRFRIDDDAALVLDTSLVGGSGVPRHEVYWPSQVDEDHQEFYYRLQDAFYRVDLAPHCHLSAIQPTCVLNDSSRTLALLWRVVNPSRAMAVRKHNFVELLERGLASWRPQFQQLISRDDDVPAALLSAVAGDRYWASLGLRVSAQLCAHRENGELNNFLTTTSWHFLTDALQDRRRWFPFVDRAIRAHAGSELEEHQRKIPIEELDKRPELPALPQPQLWGGYGHPPPRSDDDTQALYPIPNPSRCGPNRVAPLYGSLPQPSREWS